MAHLLRPWRLPRALATLLLFALAGAPAAQDVQLLLNGSFERPPIPAGSDVLVTAPRQGRTSSLPGWSSVLDRITLARDMDGVTTRQGRQFANVHSETNLRQQVYTEAGFTYELRFAVSPRPSESGPRTLRVSLGTLVVDDLIIAPGGPNAWNLHTYEVQGLGTLAALSFEDVSPTASTVGVLLDACSLTGQGPPAAGEILAIQKIGRRASVGLTFGAQDQFSRDITLLGDVDGDGVPDLAAGAQGVDTIADRAGAVFVLLMNADGTVKQAIEILEGAAGFGADLDAKDFFGHSVAGIGDLNGDGVVDLAVGAKGDDDAGSAAGALYILFLQSDGTVGSWHKITGTSAGDSFDVPPTSGEFGSAVECLGDVDGDGIQDLGVGRRLASPEGWAYVCFMRRDGTVRESKAITFGTAGFDLSPVPLTQYAEDFGTTLGRIGDLDGDGTPDMVVGMPHAHYLYGAAYVLFLQPDGAVKRWTVLDHTTLPLDDVLTHTDFKNLSSGEARQSRNFAYGLDGVGDIDKDGVADLLVGASYDGRGGDRIGAALMLFMNSDGSVKRILRYGKGTTLLQNRIELGDEFGQSITPLGDFNQDGTLDVAVGVRFDDDAGNGAGAFYLMYLGDGAPPAVTPSFTAAPTSGLAPLEVSFQDTSTGTPVSWNWNFGDGTSSTQAAPRHTYTADGTYTVSLSVLDDQGVVYTATRDNLVRIGGPDVLRYGCGENPVGSLQLLSGTPVLGSELVFGVESPHATPEPGAATLLLVSLGPFAGNPCGLRLNNHGMDGGIGMLLVSLDAADSSFLLSGSPYGGTGSPGLVTLEIPDDPALLGARLYAQGVLVASTEGGIRRGLSDALEVLVR